MSGTAVEKQLLLKLEPYPQAGPLRWMYFCVSDSVNRLEKESKSGLAGSGLMGYAKLVRRHKSYWKRMYEAWQSHLFPDGKTPLVWPEDAEDFKKRFGGGVHSSWTVDSRKTAPARVEAELAGCELAAGMPVLVKKRDGRTHLALPLLLRMDWGDLANDLGVSSALLKKVGKECREAAARNLERCRDLLRISEAEGDRDTAAKAAQAIDWLGGNACDFSCSNAGNAVERQMDGQQTMVPSNSATRDLLGGDLGQDTVINETPRQPIKPGEKRTPPSTGSSTATNSSSNGSPETVLELQNPPAKGTSNGIKTDKQKQSSQTKKKKGKQQENKRTKGAASEGEKKSDYSKENTPLAAGSLPEQGQASGSRNPLKNIFTNNSGPNNSISHVNAKVFLKAGAAAPGQAPVTSEEAASVAPGLSIDGDQQVAGGTMPGEGCWRATLQEGGQVTPAVVKFTAVEAKFKKDMALMRKTKSRGIPSAMIGGEVKLSKGSGRHFLLVMPDCGKSLEELLPQMSSKDPPVLLDEREVCKQLLTTLQHLHDVENTAHHDVYSRHILVECGPGMESAIQVRLSGLSSTMPAEPLLIKEDLEGVARAVLQLVEAQRDRRWAAYSRKKDLLGKVVENVREETLLDLIAALDPEAKWSNGQKILPPDKTRRRVMSAAEALLHLSFWDSDPDQVMGFFRDLSRWIECDRPALPDSAVDPEGWFNQSLDSKALRGHEDWADVLIPEIEEFILKRMSLKPASLRTSGLLRAIRNMESHLHQWLDRKAVPLEVHKAEAKALEAVEANVEYGPNSEPTLACFLRVFPRLLFETWSLVDATDVVKGHRQIAHHFTRRPAPPS